MLESLNNSKIKRYLKLKTNKKHRKEEKCFVVEGVRLIFEALKNKVEIIELFLTEECEEKCINGKYDLTKFKSPILISKKIAEKFSFVETNQGAFAILKEPKNFKKEEIKNNEKTLALFNVKDPGNLGSLFRSAFSFGFFKIILHNCCSIYNEKVIRASMGTIFKLFFLDCKDFEDVIAFLKNKNIKTYATALHQNSKTSRKIKGEKGVLVLGGEANGLPLKIIKMCDEIIEIKMLKFAESLNVACAGSILMYEMSNYI